MKDKLAKPDRRIFTKDDLGKSLGKNTENAAALKNGSSPISMNRHISNGS